MTMDDRLSESRGKGSAPTLRIILLLSLLVPATGRGGIEGGEDVDPQSPDVSPEAAMASAPDPSTRETDAEVVGAPDTEGGEPGLIPGAVVETDFTDLRAASPFRRVLDPSEKFVLRGVASLEDLVVATIQDRETEKTFVVTPEEAGERGLRLLGVRPGRDLEGWTARLSFGEEEFELQYENDQLFPDASGSAQGGDGGGRSRDRRRGPSKEDIERFRSLSEENRSRLRQYVGQVMRSYPELSREEKGNMIRGAMMRLRDGRDIDMPDPANGGPQGGPPRGGGSGGNQR